MYVEVYDLRCLNLLVSAMVYLSLRVSEFHPLLSSIIINGPKVPRDKVASEEVLRNQQTHWQELEGGESGLQLTIIISVRTKIQTCSFQILDSLLQRVCKLSFVFLVVISWSRDQKISFFF